MGFMTAQVGAYLELLINGSNKSQMVTLYRWVIVWGKLLKESIDRDHKGISITICKCILQGIH